MTAIVGMLCQDGVVIGADSSVTISGEIEQPTKKIDIVGGKIIVAGAGDVGFGQRFVHEVRSLYSTNLFNSPLSPVQKSINISTKAIKNFSSTGINVGAIGYTALLAYSFDNSFYLCQFTPNQFQPIHLTRNLWYSSIGNGFVITDTFLGFLRRCFMGGQMPVVNTGKFLVAWTLYQACDINAGGIKEPIKLATLTASDGNIVAENINDDEMKEHTHNIKSTENYISDYIGEIQGDEGEPIPTLSGD